MFKKYKWLFLFLFFIIALIIVSVVFSNISNDSKNVHDISFSEVTNKIKKKESFILYIKQTDCEHCKAFTPKFISVLNDNNIEAYSLNLTNLSDNDKEAYNKMAHAVNPYGDGKACIRIVEHIVEYFKNK